MSLLIGDNAAIVAVRDNWIRAKLRLLPEGTTLLDVGAGQCPFRKDCSHLRYFSQDFAQYEGFWEDQITEGSASKNKIDIVSDIVAIPVPDASYDAILCSEVLEHVPDPLAALREMQRILKLGGRLILTAPFASYSHFEPFHFSSGFSRFFYQHHLPDMGFKILDLQMNGNYYEYLALKIRWISDVAPRYGSGSLDVMDKLAIRGMLRTLDKFSRFDRDSGNFLNNGFFVFAQKN